MTILETIHQITSQTYVLIRKSEAYTAQNFRYQAQMSKKAPRLQKMRNYCLAAGTALVFPFIMGFFPWFLLPLTIFFSAIIAAIPLTFFPVAEFITTQIGKQIKRDLLARNAPHAKRLTEEFNAFKALLVDFKTQASQTQLENNFNAQQICVHLKYLITHFQKNKHLLLSPIHVPQQEIESAILLLNLPYTKKDIKESFNDPICVKHMIENIIDPYPVKNTPSNSSSEDLVLPAYSAWLDIVIEENIELPIAFFMALTGEIVKLGKFKSCIKFFLDLSKKDLSPHEKTIMISFLREHVSLDDYIDFLDKVKIIQTQKTEATKDLKSWRAPMRPWQEIKAAMSELIGVPKRSTNYTETTDEKEQKIEPLSIVQFMNQVQSFLKLTTDKGKEYEQSEKIKKMIDRISLIEKNIEKLKSEDQENFNLIKLTSIPELSAMWQKASELENEQLVRAAIVNSLLELDTFLISLQEEIEITLINQTRILDVYQSTKNALAAQA